MVAFATQVKRRRGTTAQNDAFTGAEGEIVVDTERHELRVHDGVTQGGYIIPTNETLDSANKSLDNLSQEGEARFTNKADSDLSNTPSNIDYVIESQLPTADNGYTWYRKYKSGWVEQGGTVTTASGAATPVTLPIPMVPNQFFITNSSRQPVDDWSAVPTVKKDGDGTKIAVAIVPVSGSGTWVSGTIDWQVSGVSA